MSVTKPPVGQHPGPNGGSEKPNVHPLIAVSLCASLAALAGMLTDWQSALTVFVVVLEFLKAPRRSGEGNE